jgi:hypothetical protein
MAESCGCEEASLLPDPVWDLSSMVLVYRAMMLFLESVQKQ